MPNQGSCLWGESLGHWSEECQSTLQVCPGGELYGIFFKVHRSPSLPLPSFMYSPIVDKHSEWCTVAKTSNYRTVRNGKDTLNFLLTITEYVSISHYRVWNIIHCHTLLRVLKVSMAFLITFRGAVLNRCLRICRKIDNDVKISCQDASRNGLCQWFWK